MDHGDEEDQGDGDLVRPTPERVQVGHGVLQPLRVDGHEVHDLPSGALLALARRTWPACPAAALAQPAGARNPQGLGVDEADGCRVEAHACAEAPVEVLVQERRLHEIAEAHEGHKAQALPRRLRLACTRPGRREGA